MGSAQSAVRHGCTFHRLLERQIQRSATAAGINSHTWVDLGLRQIWRYYKGHVLYHNYKLTRSAFIPLPGFSAKN